MERCANGAEHGHRHDQPTHAHFPRKGMGGNNPKAKIVAIICWPLHDATDNGLNGMGVNFGEVRIWDLHNKTILRGPVGASTAEGEDGSGVRQPQSLAVTPASVPSIAESLKPNGLELPEEYTFQEWTDLAGMVAGMNKNRQWWAGDLMLAGERFGERATQLWNDMGYKYESLANCIRVCRRFPRPLRNEALQFSHHAVVHSLDDDEAANFLAAAEGEGWTVKQLREAVFGRKPKTVRWTLEELRTRLEAWPGERSVRNNGRKFAEAFLESLE